MNFQPECGDALARYTLATQNGGALTMRTHDDLQIAHHHFQLSFLITFIHLHPALAFCRRSANRIFVVNHSIGWGSSFCVAARRR